MIVSEFELPGVKILIPKVFADERGVFCETFVKRQLEAFGIDVDFVQDNQSVSMRAGTIRGLHFQIPPAAQDKLIRVVRGRIFDVAVDVRRGSPSFGQFVSTELSAKSWNQIFVPKGYAHGFCTLEDDTAVIYKTSDYYAPEHDRGIAWNDPDLRIKWPVAEAAALLSEKDRKLPRLKDAAELFDYDAAL